MSLRDLAAGPACAPVASSSRNPLSAVADALLPKTSHNLLPRAAAAQAHRAPTSAFEAQLLHGELPPDFAPPPPPLAPPLPAGATAQFEAAFRDLPPPAFEPAFTAAFPRPAAMSDALAAEFAAANLSDAPSRELWRSLDAARVAARGEAFSYGKAPLVETRHPVGLPPMSRALAAAAVRLPPASGEAFAPALGALASSRSWGDEFTSLESGVPDVAAEFAEGKAAQIVEEAAGVGEELRYGGTFEDMYEAAFREYLGREPALREYRFAERAERERYGRSALEALEEAVRLREGGKLGLAIRAFEEALDRDREDPHPPLDAVSTAKAWFLLGLSLAETDDDATALQALQRGLGGFSGVGVGERRQDNPYFMQSLIALAVSYTNELDQPQAYGHIKEWFELWKTQTGIRETGQIKTTLEDAFQDAGTAGSQRLLEQMHKAAESKPDDVDIFIVMGVLHNLNREYSAAADTLRYAVMLRPNDPSLWNKLGATLANGGNGDDALRAYRRAVDINPALLRAWVNVGTAYANRGEFPKAARYYLKAVSMAEEQETSARKKGISRTEDRMPHVWGYLRTTLISMSRADILHLVDARDIERLRSHFAF